MPVAARKRSSDPAFDSAVAREFLRQANSPNPDRPELIDLNLLYEAAEAQDVATMAPPLFWKYGAKAIHGTDPLEDAEVIDGRVYGHSLVAGDYAMNVDPELGPAYLAFHKEITDRDAIIEPLVELPTTTRAFFAVATVLTVAWHEENTIMTPSAAVKHLLACVGQWAENLGGLAAETAVARVQRAIRGEANLAA